jgi:hypothetical protein
MAAIKMRGMRERWPRFSLKVFLGLVAIMAAFMTRAYEGESFDLLNSVLSGAMFAIGWALLFSGKLRPKRTPTQSEVQGLGE